jgi:hypothetical protein
MAAWVGHDVLELRALVRKRGSRKYRSNPPRHWMINARRTEKSRLFVGHR